MKKLILLIALAVVSCGKTTVSWKEGETMDKRYSNFTMEIQNPPAGTGWYIWFSQFRTPTTMQEGSQGRIEHVSGTLYRIIPEVDTKGEALHLDYKAKTLVNQCRAPEAFYLVRPGKRPVKLDVSYDFLPQEPKHSFEWNHVNVNPEDIIPRLKSVEKGDGETAVPSEWASVAAAEGKVPGWYRITLQGDKAALEAADADAEYWAGITLGLLRESAAGAKVQDMVIEDWPDLQYRGLMLDVSRNFTTKDNLLKLIDLMSRYKANVLHLHMGDDEGWRVEIDALPELTSYGAFRGLPVLRDYMNGCVIAARQGSVMVSPFISAKEKEVLIILLTEEHPTIILTDNGFGQYYKPSAGLFDAVAAGKLLILSPWQHDPGKKHISRADCVALNTMAEEISSSLSHP